MNVSELDANSQSPKLVYEYASTFGAVPFVTHQVLKSEYVSNNPKGWLVSIQIPTLKIQSSARSTDFRHAFILAAQEILNRANLTSQKHQVGLTATNAEALVRANLVKQVPTVEVNFRQDLYAAEAQLKWGEKEAGPIVVGLSKKEATQLAWLAAAVRLSLSLSSTPVPAASGSNTQGRRRTQDVYPYPVEHQAFQLAENMLRDLGPQNAPSGWNADVTNRREDNNSQTRTLTYPEIEQRNQELTTHLKQLKQKMTNIPRYTKIRNQREELTINLARDKVLELVNNNDYSILVSGTGSGKTTQLPQLLLEEAIANGIGAHCNVSLRGSSTLQDFHCSHLFIFEKHSLTVAIPQIICTQPRRIAATSVARRVAVERNDGELRSVGHQVRFDSNPPKPGGSINYCTTGIFLKQMQHNPAGALDNISHIIVDETHERDINIDSLLALLKSEICNRKSAGLESPKIVLASATLDINLFSKYFMQTTEDGTEQPAPHIEIQGRVFDVEHKYLDDVQMELLEYGEMQTSLLTKDRSTEHYLKSEQVLGKSS
jgi:ATP-dependent RNA helicase DHX36